MTLQMYIPADPTEDDRQAVGAPLVTYNAQHGGDANMRKLAVILMDEAGSRVGGLWGKSVYDWLFVEWLAVPEGHRERGHWNCFDGQSRG